MSEYIKNFVIGHGISFPISKRNLDTFEKAAAAWSEIESGIEIKGNSTILFCGAKNNGKSSLVRFLLNRYNKVCPTSTTTTSYAYYVDFDPGQPEMTTPGIVSAHIVHSNRRPLTSPTYLNVFQHEPIAMSSVGGVNMSVNPRMYIENCRYIMSRVREHQNSQAPNERRPIFINTMGFIRNVGLAMLMDLIKSCRPTNVIVLNVENDPMRSVYADLSPEAMQNTRASFYYESSEHDPHSKKNRLDYRYDVHNLQFAFVDSTSIATKNRTALQLAYFASIPDALYKPILQLDPKWLSLKDVSISCVSSYPLKSSIVLELLYHSWVHLVKQRKPLTTTRVDAEDDTSSFVCRISDDVEENIMFGCGIVADIDMELGRLAIITPLSQETLSEHVDCVIKPLNNNTHAPLLLP